MTEAIKPRATEALAEAWASIDGKLEQFQYGRDNPGSTRDEEEGYYQGYLCDAASLIERLKRRGYNIFQWVGNDW